MCGNAAQFTALMANASNRNNRQDSRDIRILPIMTDVRRDGPYPYLDEMMHNRLLRHIPQDAPLQAALATVYAQGHCGTIPMQQRAEMKIYSLSGKE